MLGDVDADVVSSAFVFFNPELVRVIWESGRAKREPDDAAGRVMQQLHVLRELRGGLHGVAVLASGLSPLEAMIVNNSAMADTFGWPEPYPDPEPLRPGYADAEATTTRLVAPAFAVLSDDEREQIATLLEGVQAAAAA